MHPVLAAQGAVSVKNGRGGGKKKVYIDSYYKFLSLSEQTTDRKRDCRVSTRLEGLKRELLSPRPRNPSTLNPDDWAAARERQQFVEQDRNSTLIYIYVGVAGN